MPTGSLAPVASNTPALAAVAGRAGDYMAKSKAPNTHRAYRADWAHFGAWCASHGLAALPADPKTIALYVSAHAGALKTSTVERRLNAINHYHRAAGFEAPSAHAGVREVMKGIRREHGTAKAGKTAITVADLRRIVGVLPEGIKGSRDRALLLLGFAGAFRRSELVALDVEDVRFVQDEGVAVTVRRSKTDAAGEGAEVGIAYGGNAGTCPVRAVRAWFEASGVQTGPLFRGVNRHGQISGGRLSGYAVDLIVKGALVAAGTDNASAYGAHSLRAGHATEAARVGVEERAIMRQGRWKSERTVRGYIRHGSLFVENSSARLGL